MPRAWAESLEEEGDDCDCGGRTAQGGLEGPAITGGDITRGEKMIRRFSEVGNNKIHPLCSKWLTIGC